MTLKILDGNTQEDKSELQILILQLKCLKMFLLEISFF
jgi:hypothetical protein